MIVDVHFQVDHAGDFRLGEHHVVQGFVSGNPSLASPQFDVQHAPAGDPKIAMKGAFELRIELFDCDRGEEAETAEVHGEQREIVSSIVA